jgi:predicted methyltransferase
VHDQARAGFQSAALAVGLPTGRYLDLGGFNVNGTVWDLLPPGSVVTVLDYRGGPGVDIVADARTWHLDGRDPFDAVISTELLEHVAPLADEVAEGWALVVGTAFDALAPGGVFVGTCASNGRSPHAADGNSSIHPSEHYANVDPDDLRHALLAVGFTDVTVTYQASPGDVYWSARRPKGDPC